MVCLRVAKNGIKFFEHRGMSQESMFDVLEMIYLRLEKLFAKKGYVTASGEASVPEDIDSDVLMPFRPRCSQGLSAQRKITCQSVISASRS